MIQPSSSASKVELLPPENESIDPFLKELSEWMDTKFELPGLGWRFGLDALLGLIPGLGDLISFMVSCYVIQSAARYGVPRITIARMGMNVAIDLTLGSIPLIGDIFDVAWKSNTRNVELLRRTLESPLNEKRRSTWADWLFVIGGMILLFLLMITIVYLMWSAIRWLFSGLDALFT